MLSESTQTNGPWDKTKLLYTTVTPKPRARNDKGEIIWETLTVEARRIPDKRGVDNKIELTHPFTEEKTRTPWYYIPNIIDDFEISQKLGYNAALILMNQLPSRVKVKEDKIP